jgi:heme oxygenase (mycobilin-producing)
MIKRFVKMRFKPENINDFKDIFKNSRDLIKGFEGCNHVELLQDEKDPCIFFTFSLWDDEKYLNAYRESELFANVWAATKALFSDKAQAWSLKEPSLY